MARKIDDLIVPVYATIETVDGVQADSSMFYKSDIVILRFYAIEDNREHSIFVIKPKNYDDENCNYYDLKAKNWKY